MSKKIKIGIVGYGNISKKHIAAINKNKKFEIVSICDSKSLKIKYKKYKFFNDMLKTEKDIDLVTILSPSGYHYDQIIKSLKYRKHVIVEKPICMNLYQAKKVMIYEKKYKRKVFVVYQNRLNPLIKFVRKKIKDKALGKLIMFNSSLSWNRDDKYFKKSKWRGTKKLDGGVIMNQGIHNLDIFYNLFGEVKSLYCIKSKIKKFLECEDTCVTSITFKNGLIGNFSISTAVNKENYSNILEIFGVKNNIKLYGKNLNILDYKKKVKVFEKDGELHFNFYKLVYKSIVNKKLNQFSSKSVLHSMKIIDAVNKSIKLNSKIFL